ncbi:ISC1 [Candida theae]|uniref:ISC1 n=1 Tax=Candida theae TaxID=1198502 RepID=A0AAD5BHV2_9ASCO|nr:ISC1 [Candida theae]KAI5962896.1 ISC1 [Candida theae]
MASEHVKRESIRLLTFNTWGLKLVSKFRKQRLRAIADKLAEPQDENDDYDIVALQEVWCEEDWEYLDQVCRKRYPFRRFFKAGIISGPGLCVLSKVPISETFLYRFPINGRPSAFFRGDWFVGKSIAVTMFQQHHPGALPIALLNSHMHAPYGHGDASYSTHRACQAWDFAKIVRMLKKAGFAVIQVGDLNSKPESLPYKIFTIEGGLSDSWNVLHGEKIIPTQQLERLSPEEQVLHGGVTCNSRLNTWRKERPMTDACRLDYALIDPNCIIPLDAKVKFTETLPPPLRCSLSDHFAYFVELKVRPRGSQSDKLELHSAAHREAVYKELLSEVNHYRTHTIPFQAGWRKLHFILSILIVIGMHVAIVFVSNVAGWSSVLFLFATSVILVTGLLNGLIWALGVRSESRALQEVTLEVKDAYVYLKDHAHNDQY